MIRCRGFTPDYCNFDAVRVYRGNFGAVVFFNYQGQYLPRRKAANLVGRQALSGYDLRHFRKPFLFGLRRGRDPVPRSGIFTRSGGFWDIRR